MTSTPPAPPDWYPPERSGAVRFLAVALGLLVVAALVVGAYRLGAANAGSQAIGNIGTSTLSDDLAPVEDLYTRLLAESVRAPDSETLINGALEGMTDALDDAYATFYDDDEFADVSEFIDGAFGGVGMFLEESEDGLEIVRVIEGTPSDDAGVQAGERIIAVDGDDVVGQPVDSVVQRVRGEEGTTVTLTLAGGDHGERDVELTRARIEIPLVETEMLDDGTAQVSVLRFARGVTDEVGDAVREVEEEGADGIVLDLRGNPGGLLTEAVEVTSLFVEDGPAAFVKEREGERESYDVSGDPVTTLPMVVLVDGFSASASEIVAGAIQDADRGLVVGEQTFGKGTVQTLRRLEGGRGVRFTTAEYFTRSGDSIEEVGVTPDEELDGDPDEQLAEAQQILRESLAASANGESGS